MSYLSQFVKVVSMYENLQRNKDTTVMTEKEKNSFLNVKFPNFVSETLNNRFSSKENIKKLIQLLVENAYNHEEGLNEHLVSYLEKNVLEFCFLDSKLEKYFQKALEEKDLFLISLFTVIGFNCKEHLNECVKILPSAFEAAKEGNDVERLIMSIRLLFINQEILCASIQKEMVEKMEEVLIFSKANTQLKIANCLSRVTLTDGMIDKDSEKLLNCLGAIQNDQILTAFVPFCTKTLKIVGYSEEMFGKLLEIYNNSYYTQRPMFSKILSTALIYAEDEVILSKSELMTDSTFLPIIKCLVCDLYQIKKEKLGEKLIKKVFSFLNTEEDTQDVCNTLKSILSDELDTQSIIKAYIFEIIKESDEKIVEKLCALLREIYLSISADEIPNELKLLIPFLKRPLECFILPLRVLLMNAKIDFDDEESKIIVNYLTSSIAGADLFIELIKKYDFYSFFPMRKNVIKELLNIEYDNKTSDIFISTYDAIRRFKDKEITKELLLKILYGNCTSTNNREIQNFYTKNFDMSWGKTPLVDEKEIFDFINNSLDSNNTKHQEAAVNLIFKIMSFENDAIYPTIPSSHLPITNENRTEKVSIQFRDRKYDFKFNKGTTMKRLSMILSSIFEIDSETIKIKTKKEVDITLDAFTRITEDIYIVEGTDKEERKKFEEKIIDSGIFDKMLKILKETQDTVLLNNIYLTFAFMRDDQRIINGVKENPGLLLQYSKEEGNSQYRSYMLEAATKAIVEDKELVERVNNDGSLKLVIENIFQQQKRNMHSAKQLLEVIRKDQVSDKIITLLCVSLQKIVAQESFICVMDFLEKYAEDFSSVIEENQYFIQALIESNNERMPYFTKIINKLNNKGTIFHALTGSLREIPDFYRMIAAAYDGSKEADELAENILKELENTKGNKLLCYLIYLDAVLSKNTDFAESNTQIVDYLIKISFTSFKVELLRVLMKCISDVVCTSDEEVHGSIYKYLEDKFKTFVYMETDNIPKTFDDVAGYINNGASCYINAVLQQLYNTPQFVNALFSDSNDSQESDNLKNLFVLTKITPNQRVNPMSFINSVIGPDGQKVYNGVQGDSHEFLLLLLDKLKDSNSDCFKGEMIGKITGLTNNYVSETKESFLSLSVPVKGVANLSEALNTAFLPELFNGNNQISVEELGKFDASRQQTISKCPEVLIIQLKRFEYDMTTYRRIKLSDKIEIPENIDIGCYTTTKESKKYRLKGLILHAGTTEMGHYVSVVNRDKKWILLNDDIVSTISSIDAVLNQKSKATFGFLPYILVYEQESANTELINYVNMISRESKIKIISSISLEANFKSFITQEGADLVANFNNIYFMLKYLVKVAPFSKADMSYLQDNLIVSYLDDPDEFTIALDSIINENTDISRLFSYQGEIIEDVCYKLGQVLSSLEENYAYEVLNQIISRASNGNSVGSLIYGMINENEDLSSFIVHKGMKNKVIELAVRSGRQAPVNNLLKCCLIWDNELTFEDRKSLLKNLTATYNEKGRIKLLFLIARKCGYDYVNFVINYSGYEIVSIMEELTKEDFNRLRENEYIPALIYQYASEKDLERLNKVITKHFKDFYLEYFYNSAFGHVMIEALSFVGFKNFNGLVDYKDVQSFDNTFASKFHDRKGIALSKDVIEEIKARKNMMMSFLHEVALSNWDQKKLASYFRVLTLYMIRSGDNKMQDFDKIVIKLAGMGAKQHYPFKEAVRTLSIISPEDLSKSTVRRELIDVIVRDRSDSYFFIDVLMQMYTKLFNYDESFLIEVMNHKDFIKGFTKIINHAKNIGTVNFIKTMESFKNSKGIMKKAAEVICNVKDLIFTTKNGMRLVDLFNVIDTTSEERTEIINALLNNIDTVLSLDHVATAILACRTLIEQGISATAEFEEAMNSFMQSEAITKFEKQAKEMIQCMFNNEEVANAICRIAANNPIPFAIMNLVLEKCDEFCDEDEINQLCIQTSEMLMEQEGETEAIGLLADLITIGEPEENAATWGVFISASIIELETWDENIIKFAKVYAEYSNQEDSENFIQSLPDDKKELLK